jgi:hypothetical protein
VTAAGALAQRFSAAPELLFQQVATAIRCISPQDADLVLLGMHHAAQYSHMERFLQPRYGEY